MKKIKYMGLKVIIISILGLIFTGCGAITQPNLNLVKNYKQPVKVKSDEKLVYVIRESTPVGAARGLWVAHNKNVIADLGSGDYTYFKVPVGINTINTVQATTGVGYFAIDELNNETVFLKFNYAKGEIIQLPKNIGITYVMEYDYVSTLKKKRKNDGYEIGVMNLAKFDNLKIMSKTNKLLEPDSSSSVLTFFCDQDYKNKATIWHDTNIAGNLDQKSFFQIKLPAGKHYFYVKGQVYYALEANIKAGKNYAVELDVSIGWNAAHTPLKPINLNEKNLSSLLSNLTHLKLDKPLKDNIIKRIKIAQPILNKVKGQIDTGRKIPKTLESNFGN